MAGQNESAPSVQTLLHELRVHQIELETQNEELRQAQTRLDAMRAKYFDLYDQAPVGYCTLSEKGLILEANLTAAQLLGTARGELVKQPFTRFIAKEDQDKYYLNRLKLFENSLAQAIDLRMVKMDGTMFFGQLTALVVEGDGNEKVARVVLTDVSARKQAEENNLKYEQQLLQMQKLDSLGVLAGGMAHDFNNIMAMILGYVELAIKKTKDEAVTGILKKTFPAMDRAQGLTSQLLTFAKGGAPVLKIDRLGPFVQETAQFALSGSNVTCRYDLPADLWACHFDKNQIGQVIGNIIINAQQAMPAGGTIELSAQNLSLKKTTHPTLPQGDYIRISIRDCGMGIPQDLLTRIFEPFFTTKTKGHGLGLATAYSIVNRHGGCIDVESEQGKGSAFHVYLPALKEAVINAPSDGAAVHQGCGTFLVMDDEKPVREIMRGTLEYFGYTVVCKENGQEAIDFFLNETKANRKLTGMIFDLTVPGGMGGEEAIAEIRKVDMEIPVFVVSGYAQSPVVANPAEYGFTASLGKPFKMEQMAALLNRYLKKQG